VAKGGLQDTPEKGPTGEKRDWTSEKGNCNRIWEVVWLRMEAEMSAKDVTTSVRKPYSERDDIERLRASWKKLTGLMNRKEWSAAITRAATAAEIAANIAIRHELQENRNLEASFVNHLLKWANGLSGKLDKLLDPLHTTKERSSNLYARKRKQSLIREIRHSDNFMNEKEAKEITSMSRDFIETVVGSYHKLLLFLIIRGSNCEGTECREGACPYIAGGDALLLGPDGAGENRRHLKAGTRVTDRRRL
jgi:hypothetical protein